MNPTVWGPPLWRIFNDVARHSDASGDPLIRKATARWFLTLRDLLPCVWCRNSYRGFLEQVSAGPRIENGQALRVIFDLHEKVNDKLQKQNRIPYEMFLRRVYGGSRMASPTEVLDFFAILALNLELPKVLTPNDLQMLRQKQEQLVPFHTLFAFICPYPELATFLSQSHHLVRESDVIHQSTYAKRIYQIYKMFFKLVLKLPVPTEPLFWKQYENVRATVTQPIVIPS